MCPRCGCGPETILHVCRDCPGILHIWHNLGISWDPVLAADDTPINWVGQLFAQGTRHVRVNFDAGFFANLHVASAGVIVWDSAGLILGLACFWQDNGSCLLTSEALAWVRDICFAQDLGFRKVELEGDSTVLLSKLNAAAIDRSTISSIIWDAKRLVLGFEHFKFHHIQRGGNTVAHLFRDQHRFRRRWMVIGGGGSDLADMITDIAILARYGSFLAIFVSTSTLYVDRWLTLGVLEHFRV
ncbi:hypothetical protein Goari_017819 [Gossypium aridum]|uniref:RNase H type-1 domain-containing protein n=1 Tax=Gossypium aridum TaxID=34290 RepID=A0A7J8WN86_GOSAI|nr:hypothetical protein [Gossypium aridum]